MGTTQGLVMGCPCKDVDNSVPTLCVPHPLENTPSEPCGTGFSTVFQEGMSEVWAALISTLQIRGYKLIQMNSVACVSHKIPFFKI